MGVLDACKNEWRYPTYASRCLVIKPYLQETQEVLAYLWWDLRQDWFDLEWYGEPKNPAVQYPCNSLGQVTKPPVEFSCCFDEISLLDPRCRAD